ncbi:MAG: XRE family transcriptional regulator [Balneolaceae bacterium]|nr:XRE family transcriptional regulator [Balneolaceae bacterium]
MISALANINPQLLTFSRERIGYAIPDIAQKLQVREEKWLSWEKGEQKPTTNQLIRIANYLDRTPAFFYLNSLPDEREPLSEFRTINNKLLVSGSPKLIAAIREAKRNRETLLELYSEQRKTPVQIPSLDMLNGTVQEKGERIRNWLGISMSAQNAWRSSSEALTNWKNLIEEKDIYVVQFPFVDVDECRGFALSEEPVPIIGINSKDSYNARIFTLIHELAHILYRDSVLINDSLAGYFESGRTLEQKCNRLAAEILVPEVELIREFNAQSFSVKEVMRLSRKFRVSGYVLLIRLKTARLITEEAYRALESQFSFYDSSGKGSDGGNPYYNQIVRKGRLYLKTAFQSYFDNQINVVELANLTGWKVPNLNELAAKTFGWPKEGRYL